MADYTKVDGVAAADIVRIDGAAISTIEKVDGATKPVVAAIDWTDSLWMDDNLTSAQGTWTGDTAYSSIRRIGGGTVGTSDTYRDFPLPFIDDSGGTKYLKMIVAGNQSATTERFQGVDAGTRVQVNSGNNPDIVCVTSSGVAFDGSGDLVDGQHVIQFRWYHEGGKTDTFYNMTGVLDCSSNVLIFAIKQLGTTAAHARVYPTVSATLAAPYRGYVLTYDPSDNTWSRTGGWNYGWGWWRGQSTSHLGSMGADSDAHGIECLLPTSGALSYHIDSDTDETRMFYFKSG